MMTLQSQEDLEIDFLEVVQLYYQIQNNAHLGLEGHCCVITKTFYIILKKIFFLYTYHLLF